MIIITRIGCRWTFLQKSSQADHSHDSVIQRSWNDPNRNSAVVSAESEGYPKPLRNVHIIQFTRSKTSSTTHQLNSRTRENTSSFKQQQFKQQPGSWACYALDLKSVVFAWEESVMKQRSPTNHSKNVRGCSSFVQREQRVFSFFSHAKYSYHRAVPIHGVGCLQQICLERNFTRALTDVK